MGVGKARLTGSAAEELGLDETTPGQPSGCLVQGVQGSGPVSAVAG